MFGCWRLHWYAETESVQSYCFRCFSPLTLTCYTYVAKALMPWQQKLHLGLEARYTKNQVFQGALFLVGSVLSILLATDISRHVAKALMPPQQKLCLGLEAHYTKNQNHWSCVSSSSSFESMLIFSKTYSALNNKLSCMNTLMKSAIIQVDTTPFCQWYESHVST